MKKSFYVQVNSPEDALKMIDALTASGIQCTIAPETEVRALIEAARRAANHLIMDIDRDGKGIHSTDTPEALAEMRSALVPFSESPTEPLTPSKEEALRAFISTIENTGGLCKADCDGADAGLFAPVLDAEWVDLGDSYLKACAAIGHTPKFEDEETEAEFKILSAAPVE